MLLIGWLVLTMLGMLLISEKRLTHSQGIIRSAVLTVALAGIGVLAVPNLWLQLLFGLMLLNLLREEPPGTHFSTAYPLMLTVFAAVLLWQAQIPDLIWWGLVIMAGTGIFLGGWVLAGWWYFPNGFKWELGPLRIWEPLQASMICAGQENHNNLQAIGVVATCAAVGLAWAYSPWWWLALPLPLATVVAVQVIDWRTTRMHKRAPTMTMGMLVLAAVAVLTLPLVIGAWSMLVLVPASLVVPWGIGQAMRYQSWWDSGRVRTWMVMLTAGWWRAEWTIRLFGRGWKSWLPYHDYILHVATATKRQGVLQTQLLLSTAHNEFVQMLFEHGVVGFVLLSGYCLTELWRLGHGSLEAQAVYFVGLGLCGVASALHPWTWYHHTITPDENGDIVTYSMGSPALVFMSFLAAIMVASVR